MEEGSGDLSFDGRVDILGVFHSYCNILGVSSTRRREASIHGLSTATVVHLAERMTSS